MIFSRTNKTKHLIILLTLIIFCTFTRYEGALLSIGIIVHQFYNCWILKNLINFKKIGVFCIPIIFLIGLLVWNYSQFEQFLPNPFFQKSTMAFSDLVRNVYWISFVLVFMIAHILLIMLNLKKIMKNPKTSYFIIQIIIMLIPFLFISQWANFHHRYYFVVIPLIISLSIFSFYLIKPKIISGKYSKFVFVIVVILIISYNLPTNWDTRSFADRGFNWMENSHIKIGKILGKYDELKNNTIGIIVDAGAVPFYSKWKAYDYTLNDRYTIQNGFSVERFYQQNPVMLIINTDFGGFQPDDLDDLEDDIIKSLQKQGRLAKITLHPEFENYKIIAAYPSIVIFAEKNFAAENPLLMQELIENSAYSIV